MGMLLSPRTETRSVHYHRSPLEAIGWENHLLALSSLVAIGCLAFVWYTPEPAATTIPEVVIPLGIALGLGIYTVVLKRRGTSTDRSRSMVRYAWTGAVLSGLIGVGWLALHVYYGLPIDVLPDKILTVLGIGIAAGVFIGETADVTKSNRRRPDRAQVIAETSWTNRSGDSPVLGTIVELLADVEEADPFELSPLYEEIDPDVLAELRSQNGSRWQLLFYRNGYEIRVSSQGTVTVSVMDPPVKVRAPVSSS